MIVRVLSAVVGAGMTAAIMASAHAAEVKLTAASFQSENVIFTKHFFQWVRETNERCDGTVEIAVIGPDSIRPILQWSALKDGRIDMYFGPANFYRGVLPEIDVFNLAHNDPSEQRQTGAWSVLNDLHNAGMNAWYLTTLIAGVKFFIYTTKPAAGERFDGLRLRSVPLLGHFMRSVGAETKYMAATEVLAALERGEIDGYGWPLWGVDTFGWETLTKYRYGPGFLNTAAPVLVNLDKWKSLSDKQRGCLTEMAEWVEREWPKWRDAENRAQLAVLDRAGIQYIDLGSDFARKAEDINWRILGATEPAFVEQIKPLLGVYD